ncbi:MAG TPA: nitrogen fixation protein NifZ [Rhodocyclaceae bacterium]|nr:nitrogen fixation protein NifZ [Rhodocyclaceae bacterium]
MDEFRQPKFQWGQPVLAAIDLVNDGSYPDCATDELLAARGTRGEVVQVGSHVETQTPVYLVEFADGRVVGCLEEEISPAALAAA